MINTQNFGGELMKEKRKDRPRNPVSIFIDGDIFTKLSYVFWGLSNIVRGQVAKGALDHQRFQELREHVYSGKPGTGHDL